MYTLQITTKVLSRLMGSRFQLMKKALIGDLIQYVRNQVVSHKYRHIIAYPLILPIVMVPYTNNPHFVGREEILDHLKARLVNDQEHQNRVALWELGGIG